MLLTRLLNACHHFPDIVYVAARPVHAPNRAGLDQVLELGWSL